VHWRSTRDWQSGVEDDVIQDAHRFAVATWFLLAMHASVRVQEGNPWKGVGDGPIPVNALYTEPQILFADPLHKSCLGSKLAITGGNHGTHYIAGWLDL